MESLSIERIIEQLTHIRSRPSMYFGEETSRLLSFLHGFRAACHTLGYEYDDVYYHQLLELRGWDISPSISLPTHLSEMGYSFDFVAQETLNIEIMVWENIHKSTQKTFNREMINDESITVRPVDVAEDHFYKFFPLKPREGWYWNRIEHYPVHIKWHEGVWMATSITRSNPENRIEEPLTPGLFEILSFLEVHTKP